MQRPLWPESIYLDTSALVKVITKKQYHEHVDRVLEHVQAGTIRLYVSPLLYVEALGHSRTEPFDPGAEARLLATLDSPKVIQVEFSRMVARLARGYCHDLRLKPYDAIHLASAVAAEATVLMGCDPHFPFDKVIGGVYVSLPYSLGGGDLFTPPED